MCDSSGATSWAHDKMGRVLTESRTIIGTSPWTKSAGYTYNLDGSIATISNPGVGRVMTYVTTAAGRQSSVVNTGGSINFLTSATYAPPGELASYTNGATINTTNIYNSRLQPTTLSSATSGASILNLTYDFNMSAHADNGNIRQIANGRDVNRTQNFIYDPVNRIQQAYTTGPNWGETFGPSATAPGVVPSIQGIDAWGNLTNRSGVIGKGTYEPLSAAATSQNRLTGFGYDAAGNMISNGTATYTYDAENRLISTAGWTYIYDGDGNRVKKFSGSAGTLYWPDLNGKTLNESSLGATNLHEYVYFGGKRIARIDVPAPLTVSYYFDDHLGSASVITSQSGAIQEESDYYPYGGEIPVTNTDPNNYKFTGKERDAESGLDNFGARHDASGLARFMQPDPMFAGPLQTVNPQRWNMYAYVVNNPINYLDPDGRDAVAVNFTHKVPVGGHEGIIVVHADGSATYARFGPEHAAWPADNGQVTVTPLKPVEFQSNRLPTDAAYNQLAAEVAKIEGQNPSSVRFNYFKTSEADSIMLDNWMLSWKNHRAPNYRVNGQNCAAFCIAGLIRGNAIENKNISLVPNLLFELLYRRATENWDWWFGRSPKEGFSYKICWKDEKGDRHCQP